MSQSLLLGNPGSGSKVARTRHYLHPGQVACFNTATSITTILGSCVAICLWDPSSQIGGMNHFLLPGRPGEPQNSPRYAPGAFANLLDCLQTQGANLESVRAKIFGGANMHRLGTGSLGLDNIEIAHQMLAQRDIRIVAQDIGGSAGRKIVFQTDDGTVWVKKLG